MADVVPGGFAPLQPANVGFGDLKIIVDAEDQRDVDVDARRNRFLNRRDARFGRRDFDHDVGAVDRLEQAQRLVDGRFGVVGDQRRDFQADEAVAPAGAVVDRAEQVGGVLDVVNRQRLENRVGFEVEQVLNRRVVIVRAANGFLENRRVGSDAHHAVFVDHALKLAVFEDLTANEVKPDTLSVLLDVYRGIACHEFAPLKCFLYISIVPNSRRQIVLIEGANPV